MTRRRRRALVPVALLCALAALPTPVAGAQDRPAPSVADAQEQARVLRERLAGLRVEAAASVVAYEQAEDDLAEAVAASGRLAANVEAARRRAAGSTRQAQSRIAALYRSGGSTSLLATIIDSRDPADMVSRVAALEAVVRADAGVRRAAGQDSSALDALQDRARTTTTARNRALAVQRQSEERLAANLAEQDRAVAQADAEVRVAVEQQRAAARAAAAARLAAARLAAQRAADAARAAAAQQSAQDAVLQSAPTAPGQLPDWTAGPYGGGSSYAGPPGACPVGPSHSFTDTWHAPRVGHLHQGTDVFAPLGSPSYAVVDGVIDKVNDKGIGGIALWLRGDDGDRYYYAHHTANLVRVGQRVRAGEQIAIVGRTGNAETTPAHVHFEAHPGGGAAVNPYAWLAALCAG